MHETIYMVGWVATVLVGACLALAIVGFIGHVWNYPKAVRLSKIIKHRDARILELEADLRAARHGGPYRSADSGGPDT